VTSTNSPGAFSRILLINEDSSKAAVRKWLGLKLVHPSARVNSSARSIFRQGDPWRVLSRDARDMSAAFDSEGIGSNRSIQKRLTWRIHGW
jgi:hypothetical protein